MSLVLLRVHSPGVAEADESTSAEIEIAVVAGTHLTQS
jgi:hypothetical protein